MKTCPKCGKTYSDPNLNFCLDDGSILNQSNTAGNIPAQTIQMNEPRTSGFDQPFGGQTAQQNQFVPVQNTGGQKKSKAWMWVVGILGLVVVVCGGGLGGLMLIGKLADKKDDPKWNSNFGVNNTTTSNSTRNTSTNSDSPSGVTEIDLSRWVQEKSTYGKTEFRDGLLFANAIKSDFYYVLVASIAYKSANATTKVVVRDAESGNNRLGYGLIINSNPVPLIKDYAFLINAKTGKYRVVKHSPGKEQIVVSWKDSSSIKKGVEANTLEVKDESGQLKFFINGDLVETVDGKDGYPSGVPGIYVGGSSPVSFSKMEIRK